MCMCLSVCLSVCELSYRLYRTARTDITISPRNFHLRVYRPVANNIGPLLGYISPSTSDVSELIYVRGMIIHFNILYKTIFHRRFVFCSSVYICVIWYCKILFSVINRHITLCITCSMLISPADGWGVCQYLGDVWWYVVCARGDFFISQPIVIELRQQIGDNNYRFSYRVGVLS